ncbi:putative MFS transporter, YNFM family, membrane transport protein [Pararobbsia alpina]|uniref:MFS transporter n=1 Tax=Pararobbsia alpina TaxID=621374 RepID=UPI0039A5B306
MTLSQSSVETTRELTRRDVFLMAVGCALAVSAIYYHQPLLPQIASTFGVTPTQGNLIATLTQLGYALGLLLFVPLADGVQPRKLASYVVVVNAVGLLACAAAPTFHALAALSVVVGVTAITAQIIIPAASRGAAPANQGRIVGTMLGGLSSGILIARTLSGLVGAYFGWRSMFALASIVDLVLLVVISKLPPSNSLKPIHYAELMRSLITLVRQEPVLRICAAMRLLTFGAFSAFWATLAALLAQPPYGFGPASVGAFGLISLVGLLASPHIGSLVDRIGARDVASAGAAMVALAFAIVATGARHLPVLIVGMVILDLGNRAGFVANMARIQALRPEARSRLSTVYMVSYFAGGSAGAALGGYGAHAAGWIGLAAVGASLALAAVAVSALSYLSNSHQLSRMRPYD